MRTAWLRTAVAVSDAPGVSWPTSCASAKTGATRRANFASARRILPELAERRFGNYWFQSGTPTFLVETLTRRDLPTWTA